MDRRIKYTKKIIKDTLIDLLSKKDLKKITVSEICKEADINRATFYRYYLDVYDLLDKIEEEFVNDLKNATNVTNSDTKYSVYSFSKELLNVFLENRDLAKILFNTNNNVYFLNDILEIAYEKCRDKWQHDLPNISKEDIDYASVFIFNGALGAVNYWVKNDFDKGVDEMAEIIERLSYYGTENFIYKKYKKNS